jgi:bifunctional DNase/RNase
MLRMTIEGVGFDHLKQTIVVLKDWESRKLLPIWIGAAEARSIALHLELEGAKPPRPMAHDLLMECIQFSGGHVARVVINDLQDATFLRHHRHQHTIWHNLRRFAPVGCHRARGARQVSGFR